MVVEGLKVPRYQNHVLPGNSAELHGSCVKGGGSGVGVEGFQLLQTCRVVKTRI